MTASELLVYACAEIWGGSTEADVVASLYQTVKRLIWHTNLTFIPLLEAERTLTIGRSSRCTQEELL